MAKYKKKNIKTRKRKTWDGVERRRAPRVRRRVPLEIKHDAYNLVSRTQNISSIGVYCTLNKYIAPFTLVSIIILVPLKVHDKKSVHKVHCQGVVVRSEKSTKSSRKFNTAIYFKKVKKPDKNKLSQYMLQHL